MRTSLKVSSSLSGGSDTSSNRSALSDKVILTVIRQQPASQFVAAFMNAFDSTDWSSSSAVLEWPISDTRAGYEVETNSQSPKKHSILRVQPFDDPAGDGQAEIVLAAADGSVELGRL